LHEEVDTGKRYEGSCIVSHKRSFSRSAAVFILIILSLSLTTSSVYSQGQVPVTIQGRVVDEEGRGIGGALISVYFSDGSYVGNITSLGYITSDGYFAVSLLPGSYVLYFSKEGYVKVTKNITLRSGINLGDVILVKGLKLSSSILSLSASGGDKLLLSFSVSNVGGESETVDFKVSIPEGWSTRVLGQVGNEVKRIEVSPSASLSLQLEVVVPMSALGSNNLMLTAVGKTNSTLSFTVKVEPLSKSVISCQFPGKASMPGSVVRFQVKLTNPFGVKTRFKVSVDYVPRNWTVYIKNTGGDFLTQIILDKSEYVDLVVEVTSPDTAKIGEQYRLLFKVESYDGNLLESLPLDVTLTKIEEEVKIAVASRQVTAEAGKVLDFPVTIMNTGSVDRLVLFSVEPPANWKVVFKYTATSGTTMEVSGLYVEAKKSASLVIEATPPSTVGIGTYTIPVKVSSEKGVVYTEIALKSTITGAYALSVTPSTLLTSVSIGSSTTFTARTTNTGQTPITGIKITVTGTPTGWEISTTPVRVESLKAGESYTFTVTVKTTADTVAGDYLITFTGSSDQVKSDGVQVRFTATVSTSWGLIGVGLAAAMVIALIFAFMKFRRR